MKNENFEDFCMHNSSFFVEQGDGDLEDFDESISSSITSYIQQTQRWALLHRKGHPR